LSHEHLHAVPVSFWRGPGLSAGSDDARSAATEDVDQFVERRIGSFGQLSPTHPDDDPIVGQCSSISRSIPSRVAIQRVPRSTIRLDNRATNRVSEVDDALDTVVPGWSKLATNSVDSPTSQAVGHELLEARSRVRLVVGEIREHRSHRNGARATSPGQRLVTSDQCRHRGPSGKRLLLQQMPKVPRSKLGHKVTQRSGQRRCGDAADTAAISSWQETRFDDPAAFDPKVTAFRNRDGWCCSRDRHAVESSCRLVARNTAISASDQRCDRRPLGLDRSHYVEAAPNRSKPSARDPLTNRARTKTKIVGEFFPCDHSVVPRSKLYHPQVSI